MAPPDCMEWHYATHSDRLARKKKGFLTKGSIIEGLQTFFEEDPVEKLRGPTRIRRMSSVNYKRLGLPRRQSRGCHLVTPGRSDRTIHRREQDGKTKKMVHAHRKWAFQKPFAYFCKSRRMQYSLRLNRGRRKNCRSGSGAAGRKLSEETTTMLQRRQRAEQ